MQVCLSCSVVWTIAGCIHDPVAYSQLNDSVIQHIRRCTSPDPLGKLSAAKDLIARLEKRQLYKFIGQTEPLDRKRYMELLEAVRTYCCTMLFLYCVHFVVCLHGCMHICVRVLTRM